jgi:hypothetical protein
VSALHTSAQQQCAKNMASKLLVHVFSEVKMIIVCEFVHTTFLIGFCCDL